MKNVLAQNNFEFDYFCEWTNERHSKQIGENATQNITVVNKYYHQVNNIVINNTQIENESNEHQKDNNHLKTDEAQYNENSKGRGTSLSPVRTGGKSKQNTTKAMTSTSKAQYSLNPSHEVTLFHKVSNVGNNRSKCCIM